MIQPLKETVSPCLVSDNCFSKFQSLGLEFYFGVGGGMEDNSNKKIFIIQKRMRSMTGVK